MVFAMVLPNLIAVYLLLPVVKKEFTEVAEHDSAHGTYRRYGKLITQDRETAPLRGAFRAGEDTRSLLAELGYSEPEIEALLERGVVAEPD